MCIFYVPAVFSSSLGGFNIYFRFPLAKISFAIIAALFLPIHSYSSCSCCCCNAPLRW